MPTPEPIELAGTVEAMTPMVPAKDFATSRRFYEELGFHPQFLTDKLVEMHLGRFSFLLQNYYVKDWADNLAIHLRVSDVDLWWERITSLDLARRYGVNARAPRMESWGLVAGLVDPSGVLWRIVAGNSSSHG
jgi:hypothetical protein